MFSHKCAWNFNSQKTLKVWSVVSAKSVNWLYLRDQVVSNPTIQWWDKILVHQSVLLT